MRKTFAATAAVLASLLLTSCGSDDTGAPSIVPDGLDLTGQTAMCETMMQLGDQMVELDPKADRATEIDEFVEQSLNSGAVPMTDDQKDAMRAAAEDAKAGSC